MGVFSKACGGQTESHAPLSTVRLIGLAATVQDPSATLLEICMFFVFGLGTICDIVFFFILLGLTPFSNESRDADENPNRELY